jgi:hypothetical protein
MSHMSIDAYHGILVLLDGWSMVATIAALLSSGIWTIWGHDAAQAVRASMSTQAAPKSDCR